MSHVYGVDPSAEAVEAAAVAKAAGAEVDAKSRFPGESVAALKANGLMGLSVPAEFGGQGKGPREFCAAVEELAKACASTAMVYVMHVSAVAAIVASKTLGSRAAVLKDVAAGKHLSTLAFSEKGSRSVFWIPVSALAPNGSGFKTSARKSWVTSAGSADSYVASAGAPNAKSPLESVLFLVARSSPGVSIDGAFDGIGLRGNDSAPVTFEGVPVAADALLCAPGAGIGTMLEVVLPWFAIGTAAMANGLCRAAVEATSAHLAGAGFEFDGRKLRDLPNLRSRLADMSVRTEQSRALLGHTLSLMERPTASTPLFVLQSRLAAIRAAADVTDLAMKTCGGAAFSKQLPLDRLFRDARAGWVMAPTADHLEDLVGKALTGLPLL